jgi:probable phosphoglycerate mutase
MEAVMKNILVIQHTQSIHHTNGMVGAWTDWDLTDLGRKQAENICNALKAELQEKDYVLFSSDLKRAKQTAEPLLDYIKTEPIYRRELREINLGESIGKSKKWYGENKAENPYGTQFSKYCPFPGAESYYDLWNRIAPFMDEMINNEYQNIIIVSHGVTLSLFFAIWLGLEFDDLLRFGLLGFSGGVSKLVVGEDGRREIHYMNNLSYKG